VYVHMYVRTVPLRENSPRPDQIDSALPYAIGKTDDTYYALYILCTPTYLDLLNLATYRDRDIA